MKLKTEEKENLKNRPAMNYYLQVPPKKIKSCEKEEINLLDEKDDNIKIGELGDLSSINDVAYSQNSMDTLSLTVLYPKEYKRQVLHVKMKNFSDYIAVLHALLDNKKYRYYFTYEYDSQYYLQISYYSPQRLKKISEKFEEIEVIDDYNKLEEIIIDENYFNVDVKINVDLGFLILGHRKNGGIAFHPKLMKYCYTHQIDPYILFLMLKKDNK